MTGRTDELNGALVDLHFAFRAVVSQPDQMLARRGLSRVHHRILYFIGRNPGTSINELLGTLGVSKQSLNGPLSQLTQRRLVAFTQDAHDKRIKRLRLTGKGQLLEEQLSGDQRQRFLLVFDRVGPQKEAAWREVMQLLATTDDTVAEARCGSVKQE